MYEKGGYTIQEEREGAHDEQFVTHKLAVQLIKQTDQQLFILLAVFFHKDCTATPKIDHLYCQNTTNFRTTTRTQYV